MSVLILDRHRRRQWQLRSIFGVLGVRPDNVDLAYGPDRTCVIRELVIRRNYDFICFCMGVTQDWHPSRSELRELAGPSTQVLAYHPEAPFGEVVEVAFSHGFRALPYPFTLSGVMIATGRLMPQVRAVPTHPVDPVDKLRPE